METGVQRGCLPREVCLFYFIFLKLSRITLWDVTFCFHKRTQGVRQSPILYSLKIECAVVFAGLFNMSLSTNFMYKWVTVPWKYSEKEETVSKRSIKYYYIESHSEWKTFPLNLHLLEEQGTRVFLENGRGSSLPTRGLRRAQPFISPPLKSCSLGWHDLEVPFKGTLSPLP